MGHNCPSWLGILSQLLSSLQMYATYRPSDYPPPASPPGPPGEVKPTIEREIQVTKNQSVLDITHGVQKQNLTPYAGRRKTGRSSAWTKWKAHCRDPAVLRRIGKKRNNKTNQHDNHQEQAVILSP